VTCQALAARVPAQVGARPVGSLIAPGSPTMRGMLAVVWHFWVGVAMFIGAVATMGALVLGYFKDVESNRYPRDRS
jgi:hypothetical protein